MDHLGRHTKSAHGLQTLDAYRQYVVAPYLHKFIPLYPAEARAATLKAGMRRVRPCVTSVA